MGPPGSRDPCAVWSRGWGWTRFDVAAQPHGFHARSNVVSDGSRCVSAIREETPTCIGVCGITDDLRAWRRRNAALPARHWRTNWQFRSSPTISGSERRYSYSSGAAARYNCGRIVPSIRAQSTLSSRLSTRYPNRTASTLLSPCA